MAKSSGEKRALATRARRVPLVLCICALLINADHVMADAVLQQRRNLRGKRQVAAVRQKLVESTNALSTAVFYSKYVPKELLLALSQSDYQNLPHVNIVYGDAKSIDDTLLRSCFNLVESTSADDYRTSEMNWSPTKKRKEMVLPDMKYIILSYRENGSDISGVAAFLSFMITYEDGLEVVYCYEIHVGEPWQGRGIGKRLMYIMEAVGENVGVEKAMLTVFTSNIRALKMYESLGYVEDKYSPQPRKLRNGTIKSPTYIILSKSIRHESGEKT